MKYDGCLGVFHELIVSSFVQNWTIYPDYMLINVNICHSELYEFWNLLSFETVLVSAEYQIPFYSSAIRHVPWSTGIGVRMIFKPKKAFKVKSKGLFGLTATYMLLLGTVSDDVNVQFKNKHKILGKSCKIIDCITF